MTVADVVSAVLVIVSLVFFLAGTVGLLRLPDVLSRLHALTKADNVGLGFLVAALLLQAKSLFEVALLLGIQALVLVASAVSCHLIAGRAVAGLDLETEPEDEPDPEGSPPVDPAAQAPGTP